jgi:hypothetical protein
MTTYEGNLLVERFMTTEPDVLERDLLKAGTVECMHYHDDWLWLMPVLDKIESLGFNTIVVHKAKTGYSICHIHDYNTLINAISYDSDNKLTTVYNCILKFITWYNARDNQS